MSATHSGNLLNQITFEEHDGELNAKKVTIVGGSLSGGQATVSILGNVTLSDSKGYIGLVTSTIGNNVTANIQGNVTISDSKGFIGLVTVVQSSIARTIVGNVTLDDGSLTGIVGNLTLSDSKGFIGLVTSVPSTTNRSIVGNVTLSDSKSYIGLVTVGGGNVGISGNVTITDSKGFIGLVTVVQSSTARSIVGNLTLSDPKGFIGLVTAVGSFTTSFSGNVTLDPGSKTGIVGNVTLSDSKGFIGLVTAVGNFSTSFSGNVTLDPGSKTGIVGNVTLSDAKTFIGLVTAWNRNAGTTKTLIPLPVGLGNNSIATVAVPTNAQKINITNLILSSNVTTEIALKSGVTYLTGNASLGVTLFPGGGFEMPGSPDSPAWIGLPSGALVIEKRDAGGTVSKIGGGLIYFDE